MHSIRTQSPAISVNFFGRVVSDSVSEASAGEVSNDVTNLQVRLTRAPAEGGANSFSINLVPRRDYRTLIRPGDWVRIKAGNNGSAGEMLLEGTVDIVGEQQSVGSNGVAQRSITVAGRDWSKILTNTEMVFDQNLTNVEQGYLTLQAVEWFQKSNNIFLTPSDYIRNLLPLYLGQNAPSKSSSQVIRQFQYPNANKTASMAGLQLDLKDVKDTDGAAPVQFYGMELSLLRMLRYLSHPVLNELWFETGSEAGKPFKVVMREYPYSRDDFKNLDNYSLQEDECMSVSLSRHSGEVFNFFRLKPTGGLGINNDLLQSARMGYFLRNSINTFGLRRREEFTPFALFAKDPGYDLSNAPSLRTNRSFDAVVDEWLKKILVWHCRNEHHYQGSIISRFRPDIRPGRRLSYSDSYTGGSRELYIDTVTHTFNYPGPSTTSVNVSRGVDDFAELYDFEEVEKKLGVQDLKSVSLVPSSGVVSQNLSTPSTAPAAAPAAAPKRIEVTVDITKMTLTDGRPLRKVIWYARNNNYDTGAQSTPSPGLYTLQIETGGGTIRFLTTDGSFDQRDDVNTVALKAGGIVKF